MDYLSRNTVAFPKLSVSDASSLKSTLSGSFYLKVTQVVDISKPVKDISSSFLDLEDDNDEQDEPEEDRTDEDYNVKKIKGKYAIKGANKKEISKKGPRMLQLELKDQNDTSMMAIESKPIDKLNEIKQNTIIQLIGPMEIRCSNILLEARNVGSVNIQ